MLVTKLEFIKSLRALTSIGLCDAKHVCEFLKADRLYNTPSDFAKALELAVLIAKAIKVGMMFFLKDGDPINGYHFELYSFYKKVKSVVSAGRGFMTIAFFEDEDGDTTIGTA